MGRWMRQASVYDLDIVKHIIYCLDLWNKGSPWNSHFLGLYFFKREKVNFLGYV